MSWPTFRVLLIAALVAAPPNVLGVQSHWLLAVPPLVVCLLWHKAIRFAEPLARRLYPDAIPADAATALVAGWGVGLCVTGPLVWHLW